MATFDLYQLRREISERDVLICFNGPFSHTIIEEIGAAIRNHLESRNVDRSSALDVFAVYVELAQNIRNYLSRESFPPHLACAPESAIITIHRHRGRYAVSAGNIVTAEQGGALRTRIDGLNRLDSEGLKARYRECRRLPRTPDAVGAGLGLIDIARRSPEKLSYVLTPVEGGLSFFSITAVVAGA